MQQFSVRANYLRTCTVVPVTVRLQAGNVNFVWFTLPNTYSTHEYSRLVDNYMRSCCCTHILIAVQYGFCSLAINSKSSSHGRPSYFYDRKLNTQKWLALSIMHYGIVKFYVVVHAK